MTVLCHRHWSGLVIGALAIATLPPLTWLSNAVTWLLWLQLALISIKTSFSSRAQLRPRGVSPPFVRWCEEDWWPRGAPGSVANGDNGEEEQLRGGVRARESMNGRMARPRCEPQLPLCAMWLRPSSTAGYPGRGPGGRDEPCVLSACVQRTRTCGG